MMTPWIIRNYNEFGGFIPMSTQTGDGFYFGTLPYVSNATQEGQGNVADPFYFAVRKSGMNEYEQQNALVSKSWENFKTSPWQVMKYKFEAFGMTLFRPYPTERFDDPSYDLWTERSNLGWLIGRGSVGYYLFYWGYLLFYGFLLGAFLLHGITKHDLISLVGLYPLLMMFLFIPTSRLLVPFFPFIIMCASKEIITILEENKWLI